MTKRFRLLAMAALLVLPLAACDEGTTVAPDVTGSVTGTVTVDGTGAAGVTVTLQPGNKTATTAANGTYTISDVAAGAYTVTITGQPADAAFPATTQGAVVTSAAPVTVNFAGTRVRTSAISGSVTTSGGAPHAGVTVTLSGTESKTTTTAANGTYTFPGLRAGAYTVAVSGLPAGVTCTTTSQAVTVAAGALQVVSFATCNSASTGRITGRLYLDENDKNNSFDGTALEENLPAANVLITLEGPTIGVTQTTQTDASGNFSFANLAAGQYNVTIDSDDPDLPDNVEYGASSETMGPIVLAAGGTATANFPFDIVSQTIEVFAFVGVDEDNPGIAPVEGVTIDLYPTFLDATNATNRIGREVTDATGGVMFEFDRADDTAPGTEDDNLVFARFVSAPSSYGLNGEDRIEIQYDSRFSSGMAPDTFDLLNRRTNFSVDVLGIGTMEPQEGWRVAMYNDTTAAALEVVLTDEDGEAAFTRIVGSTASLPVTYWVRLGTAQPAAGTHAFTSEIVAQEGELAGRFIEYVHEGLVANQDTADIGDFIVGFADADITVRVYHEQDDEEGLTDGDNFGGTPQIDVTLTYEDEDGDEVEVTLTPVAGSGGEVTFTNIPTNVGPYMLSATSNADSLKVLVDSVLDIGIDGLGDLGGGTGETTICTDGQDEDDCGTFAIKFTNGLIRGQITDVSTTVGAEDIEVRIQGHPDNIQSLPEDTTVTTDDTGAYRLRVDEGTYYVSIGTEMVNDDGDTIWVFTGQIVDTVDVQGNDDAKIVDFIGTYAATEIHGVVVNDRDNDVNTVDAGEALADVEIELYRDNSGGPTVNADSLVAETTTDVNGVYMFTGLREGRYIIKAVQPGNAVVLQKFSATGAVVDTQVVVTTAIEPASATTDGNNLRRVGNTSPPLPRWDYDNSVALRTEPSHFTYLYSTGIAQGTVYDDNTTDGVAGMTVTLRRCFVTAGSASPPAPGNCAGSYFPGSSANSTTTAADGTFQFSGLQEGVYEVQPVAASVSGYVSSSPSSRLYRIEGAADTETAIFRARP